MNLNENIKRIKELIVAKHGIIKPFVNEQKYEYDSMYDEIDNNIEKYGIPMKTLPLLKLDSGELPDQLKSIVSLDNKEENLSESITVVIGGCCFATPSYMKEQWIKAGLSTKNVKFIDQRAVLPTENVKKIMGFSGGGAKIWSETINNSSKYDFIGLIDPLTEGYSTQNYVDKLINKTETLPSNVYAMSRYQNWGGQYKVTQSNLKKLESTVENWVVGNYQHTESGNYPYNYFTHFKSYLL
jgi:hypothetical protein